MRILFGLLVSLLSSTFFSCQKSIPEKKDFENFRNGLSHFKNHYRLGDTLSSQDDLWSINDFIDTTFLIKYQLIDTTFETEDYNKIKALKDYHCSFIAKFDREDKIVLLTYSIRIWAGDGNPILTVTIFSKTGKVLNFERIELDAIHDVFYQPVTYVTMSGKFELTKVFIEKNFEEDGDNLILTDSTAKIQKYLIDRKGLISPVE